MSRRILFAPFAAVAVAAFVAASLTSVGSGQTPANTVAVDNENIGGVVTGAKGAEAGVWVATTQDVRGLVTEAESIEALAGAIRRCLALDRRAVRSSALRRLDMEQALDRYEAALEDAAR